MLPDVEALEEPVVRSGFAETTSDGYGTEVGLFLKEPGASWHGALSSSGTASFLSSSNLPPPAEPRPRAATRPIPLAHARRLRSGRAGNEMGGPLRVGSGAVVVANRSVGRARERSAEPSAVRERARPRSGRRKGPDRGRLRRLAHQPLELGVPGRHRSLRRQPHGAVFRPARRFPGRSRSRPLRLGSSRLDARTAGGVGPGSDPGALRILDGAPGYVRNGSGGRPFREQHRTRGRHGDRRAAAREFRHSHPPEHRGDVADGDAPNGRAPSPDRRGRGVGDLFAVEPLHLHARYRSDHRQRRARVRHPVQLAGPQPRDRPSRSRPTQRTG